MTNKVGRAINLAKIGQEGQCPDFPDAVVSIVIIWTGVQDQLEVALVLCSCVTTAGTSAKIDPLFATFAQSSRSRLGPRYPLFGRHNGRNIRSAPAGGRVSSVGQGAIVQG